MGTLALNAFVFFTSAVVLQSPVAGFTCYKCISNDNAPCIGELKPSELPPSISVVECERYCTIVRTEYTDIPGEVVTLVRDCEEEPLVLNDVRTDKHYTKMYTACQTDRCNSGNGTRDPNDSDGPRRGPSSVIIVPESSSAVSITPFHFSVTIALCFCIRSYNKWTF